MKANINITELSHEDLVNILSGALYGSTWLLADYDRDLLAEIPAHKKEGVCFEDHLADMLLNGYCIYLLDGYAEGEVYLKEGRDPETIYIDDDGNALYPIVLQDILSACSSEKGYKLLAEILSGEGDYFTANNLLQIAMFGEIIYG